MKYVYIMARVILRDIGKVELIGFGYESGGKGNVGFKNDLGLEGG